MGVPISRPPETACDFFWYKNLSFGVIQVGGLLEEEAYQLLVTEDARPFMSAEEIASKKGVTFRTPISNGTCTYDLDALKRFINRRCETLDQKQCRKLTKLFRTLSKPKNAEAALEEWKEKAVLPTSYEHVKGFMLSRTRNETFCQQLSDQLAVCEQCQERPIPFKVAKDENAMQQHLLHHQQQSATRTQLYELLMSAL